MAGKANDFDFAALSISAYFSGVATGMRKLLGKEPDVPNPKRPRIYRRTMLTLTPQARAVATFTLATLLIMGSLNRVGVALVQAISPHGNISPKSAAVVIALVTLALGLAVLVIASQSVTRLEPGWAHALAQAAVLLAVIGTGIAALDLVSALAGNGFRSNLFVS
jgi:hypothetical protein